MTKRALVLVEGQTEERFVKDVLAPALQQRDLYLKPTLLVTKRVKNGPNFKGGVTSFAKFETDVRLLFQGAGDALVTTLLDYYGLPDDFPGMATRPNSTPLQRVQHVENEVQRYWGSPKNFLPFFALHEFEAWLFASREELPRVLNQPEKERGVCCNSRVGYDARGDQRTIRMGSVEAHCEAVSWLPEGSTWTDSSWTYWVGTDSFSMCSLCVVGRPTRILCDRVTFTQESWERVSNSSCSSYLLPF